MRGLVDGRLCVGLSAGKAPLDAQERATSCAKSRDSVSREIVEFPIAVPPQHALHPFGLDPSELLGTS